MHVSVIAVSVLVLHTRTSQLYLLSQAYLNTRSSELEHDDGIYSVVLEHDDTIYFLTIQFRVCFQISMRPIDF